MEQLVVTQHVPRSPADVRSTFAGSPDARSFDARSSVARSPVKRASIPKDTKSEMETVTTQYEVEYGHDEEGDYDNVELSKV